MINWFYGKRKGAIKTADLKQADLKQAETKGDYDILSVDEKEVADAVIPFLSELLRIAAKELYKNDKMQFIVTGYGYSQVFMKNGSILFFERGQVYKLR